MPPGIYEVKDIMRIMRISRNTAYKLIQQEGIPYMRVGGHYKIPAERFHQWLDSQFAHLQVAPKCATTRVSEGNKPQTLDTKGKEACLDDTK